MTIDPSTTSTTRSIMTASTTLRTATFSDWMDLQTRLVLGPRVEEQGIGAVVVASYAAPSCCCSDDHNNNIESNNQQDDDDDKVQDESLIGWILTGMDIPTAATAIITDESSPTDGGSSSWKDWEFSEILATLRRADPPLTLRFEAPAASTTVTTSSSNSISTRSSSTTRIMAAAATAKDATYNHPHLPLQQPPFEEEKKVEEENVPPPPSVVVPTGMVVPNNNDDNNINETSTKDKPSAYNTGEEPRDGLRNHGADNENDNQSESAAPGDSRHDAQESLVASSGSSSSSPAPPLTNNSNNNTPSSFNLSSWTLRVSAAAAAASNSAAAMARAAAKQVATTERSAAAATTKETTNNNNKPAENPEFQIFVQASTGAFLPLAAPADHNTTTHTLSSSYNNNNNVTNSSLLVVRRSTTQPVDAASHRFQWYRSSSSSSSNGLLFWEALPNATLSALQPSATEVGYRLRCVITRVVPVDDDEEEETDPNNNHHHSTSSENLLTGDENPPTTSGDNPCKKRTTKTTICETSQSVLADLSLLNGARQALVRGAQFGGLHGRGPAEGRVFSVTIQMGSCSSSSTAGSNTNTSNTKRHKVSAAVTLYQVAGGAAEPIHPHPMLHVTARSDYGHGKNLELVFSSSLVPPDSMVAALCTTPYRFQLQAPNRVARESILLALGVANYRGPPADLNASTILYPTLLPEEEDLLWSSDEQSVRSTSSVEILGLSSTMASASTSRRGSSLSVDRPPLPQQQQNERVRRRSSNSSASTAQHERCLSGDSSLAVDPFFDSSETVASQELELELERLRAKAARKDKVVSELQRQLAASDEQCRQTEKQWQATEAALRQSRLDHQATQTALEEAQRQLQARQEEVQEWQKNAQAFECEQNARNQTIAALEKAQRTLQNEKDVLTAAVEARDSKLAKMAALQASLDSALEKLKRTEEFENELDVSNQKVVHAQAEIDRIRASESTGQQALEQAQAQIVALQEQLQLERAKTASHQSELEKEQMTIQKLKAERNSYKQKGDSLAKEMSRVCRHGRTIREVEKILADDVTRREEVVLLREQKRKALEQVEHFRTAYEQSLSVQKLAGLDHDVGKLLERNAELERLLTELTEYLNAREMQLETLKQVNDALQNEIRGLAKASMSDHDV